MISKVWLENKKQAQKVIDDLKFKDLALMSSQMLFTKFLDIWGFGNILNDTNREANVQDTISLHKSITSKFRKLDSRP